MSEDINKQLESIRRQNVSDTIKEISQSLQAIVKEEGNAKLAEELFVRAFLPYFAGDAENPYGVQMGNWETVAGNGGLGGRFKSVDIINPEGTVIFTVPPIVDRSALAPNAGNRSNTIANIVHHAELYGKLKPELRDKWLNVKLLEKFNSMKLPDLDSVKLQHLKTWNDIFVRYGRDPIMEVTEVGNPNAPNPDAIVSSTYEIEEL